MGLMIWDLELAATGLSSSLNTTLFAHTVFTRLRPSISLEPLGLYRSVVLDSRWVAQISRSSRFAFGSPQAVLESIVDLSQFGMYIMFPIGIMYYFGTNLDSRFAVPDFWPKPGQTHTIPFEKEEISEELERLKKRRLAARARRLELEGRGEQTEHFEHREEQARNPRPDILDATRVQEPEKSQVAKAKGWTSWFG